MLELKGLKLIVQFILKLIFFYCLFVVIKAVLNNFSKTPASATNNPPRRRPAQNQSDVFEAEYTVVKEEKDS
jgi:hypothetical protein